MNKNTVLGILVAVLALGGLVALRYKPWEPKRETSNDVTGTGPRHLKVGFLPVTCHLTCPVTDFASNTTTTSTRFESQRFTDFPTVVETMKSGRLQASFMIVPLAMKLREQGVPIKICYLGHRDGSTIMVPKKSKATSLRDLKGKTVAIPNRASNQYFVFSKLMEDQGLEPGDINFVEMPPPEMPGALAVGAIDCYFVGEPHCARAEMDGTGRVLYHAKDIWPRFISCCLVVTEKLIDEEPDKVRDLVRGIAASGAWAETHRMEAGKLVAPYFRQDAKLVQYVLTQPPDRVSYLQLTPKDEEMEQIRDMGIKLKVLTKKTPMSELLAREFIPETIEPAKITVPDEPVKP